MKMVMSDGDATLEQQRNANGEPLCDLAKPAGPNDIVRCQHAAIVRFIYELEDGRRRTSKACACHALDLNAELLERFGKIRMQIRRNMG